MTQQRLYTILRYALDIEEGPLLITEDEWKAFWTFCIRHSLLGIGFCAVEKAEEKPSKEILLEWIGFVEGIERRNELLYAQCKEIQDFFRKSGFYSCILKGQGNALLYPNTLRRQSGDIDIWVDGKVSAIINHCKILSNHLDISYHHTGFTLRDGTEVEVHYRPSWMCSPLRNYRLQKWYKQEAPTQTHHFNPEIGFSFPSVEFNLIFQLSHLYNHFLFEGIGFRQIIDYYYLLLHWNGDGKGEILTKVERFGMKRFLAALMYVLKEVLNLPEHSMLCVPKKEDGDFLLSEILNSGNFGRYDERNAILMKMSGFSRKVMQLKRAFRFLTRYPEEVLFSPLRIYHVLWRKLEFWKWE